MIEEGFLYEFRLERKCKLLIINLWISSQVRSNIQLKTIIRIVRLIKVKIPNGHPQRAPSRNIIQSVRKIYLFIVLLSLKTQIIRYKYIYLIYCVNNSYFL